MNPAEIVSAPLSSRILSALCFVLLSARAAAAETTDPEASAALFARGRDALKNGDLVVACESFLESQRLDPKVGTLLNLAQCEEQRGRLLQARVHWQQAITLAETTADTRVPVARERALALEARIPKLMIRVNAQNTQGVVVELDDMIVELEKLTKPQLLDPGLHRIELSAPNHEGSTQDVRLAEGEQREIVIGLGAAKNQTAGALSAPAPPQQAIQQQAPRAPEREHAGLPGNRVAAIALGGFAVTALGFGTYFGLRAISKNEESSDYCDPNDTCERPGLRLRDEAQTAATLSTVSFAVGAGALASGAVLWFLNPSKSSSKTSFGFGPTQLKVALRW